MEGPVLIVEDYASWCEILEERLEQEDILTITHNDPAVAIDEIKSGLEYKVAVVDLSFERSRYSGTDFLHESKRMHPTIPVVIISVYREPFPSVDGSYCKFDDVSKLVEIVKRHLQRDKRPIQAQ